MGFMEVLLTVPGGPIVFLLVLAYAFLVAAFVPLPIEAVLVAPLALSPPWYVSFPLVIVIAAIGAAFGGLVALRIGSSVGQSRPVLRFMERRAIYRRIHKSALAQRILGYRYVGLMITTAIPLLPQTTTFYAFAVLGEQPVRFTVAAGIGTVVRLSLALLFAGGAVTVAT